VARLRRIFLLFGLLVAEHYIKIDRASNRAQLWRICAVFFLFFLSFPVDVSCRTDEAVFKGVQIVQFTLTLAGF
jgi:hypothetical protein